jgi:hypothetical protein
MKTSLLNIAHILSVINAVKALLHEKFAGSMLTGFEWAKHAFSLKLSWGALLALLKVIVRETVGADLEPEFFIILIAAYFLSAKNAITTSTLVNKIKRFRPFGRLYVKNELKLIS